MKRRIVLASLIYLPSLLCAQQANWMNVKDSAAAGIVRLHVVYETRQRMKPYRQGDMEIRLGTGFFVNRNLLVTNQHVVEGAHVIKIEGMATKEKFALRLAAEPSLKFDLALLEFVSAAERDRFERINGPVKPLEWSDIEEAQPGAQVTVLGFARSEQLVATQGIISSWEARHDLFQRRLDHVTLIRTDAAVNTGNSGGPVMSVRGRVVGISARYGAGENIGLLIPAITAKRVVEIMRTEGRFIETEPGLVTYNLNPILRGILDLAPDQAGLVVSHVVAESPAEKAGLRKWDIITAVNGYPIQHGEIKLELIGKLPYWFVFNTALPGTNVIFSTLREGKSFEVEVTLAPITMPRIWIPSEGDDYQPEWGFLGGMVITEVTRDLLTEIEKEGNWRWDLVNDKPRLGKIYVVSTIEPGTQAMSYQEYGLDLIQLRVLAINGNPLDGDLSVRLDEIYKAVEQQKAPQTITVEFEKNFVIQLDTHSLLTDMERLRSRYPAVGHIAHNKPRNHFATVQNSSQKVFHRWPEPANLREAYECVLHDFEPPCESAAGDNQQPGMSVRQGQPMQH